jgi:hypothetical protein
MLACHTCYHCLQGVGQNHMLSCPPLNEPGCSAVVSPSPTHFRGLAFWTRSINMMQKIGSCVGCLQVKVSHSRASSPWAARQSVSWIHVCVHLYVGVVRIGLMKIMRDAIMRMQKQRRHVYAVYCCIGAWAASGDQVFILRHIGAGAIWVDASDASHRMYKGKAR